MNWYKKIAEKIATRSLSKEEYEQVVRNDKLLRSYRDNKYLFLVVKVNNKTIDFVREFRKEINWKSESQWYALKDMVRDYHYWSCESYKAVGEVRVKEIKKFFKEFEKEIMECEKANHSKLFSRYDWDRIYDY